MNRITKCFATGPTFIGYLTAGDGGMRYSEDALMALVKGGVDILEIGIPFSDNFFTSEIIGLCAAITPARNLSP